METIQSHLGRLNLRNDLCCCELEKDSLGTVILNLFSSFTAYVMSGTNIIFSIILLSNKINDKQFGLDPAHHFVFYHTPVLVINCKLKHYKLISVTGQRFILRVNLGK